MIDTTVINYGIEKLNEAISKLKPSAEHLTVQYINFCKISAITEAVLIFLAFIIVSILWIPIIKYGKGKNGFNNYDEIEFCLPAICISIVQIIFLIFGFFAIHDAILALTCPEVFAIQSLINKK
jgi:hypothetical protein